MSSLPTLKRPLDRFPTLRSHALRGEVGQVDEVCWGTCTVRRGVPVDHEDDRDERDDVREEEGGYVGSARDGRGADTGNGELTERERVEWGEEPADGEQGGDGDHTGQIKSLQLEDPG